MIPLHLFLTFQTKRHQAASGTRKPRAEVEATVTQRGPIHWWLYDVQCRKEMRFHANLEMEGR